MNDPIREAALAAHAAGLSVVPPMQDGSKRPISEWKEYQTRCATLNEIGFWYGTNGKPSRRTGLGIVAGAVSGNLEFFEFDDRGRLYGPFVELANAYALGDLLDRLYEGYYERSPSGGYHWAYRCTEAVGGNTKLAMAADGTTLIETRGEGGYCIVAPSGGRVHKTGLSYELISGGFDTIPTITPGEREDLFQIARMFSEEVVPEVEDPWFKEPYEAEEEAEDKSVHHPSEGVRTAQAGDVTPWDDYNARASIGDILGPHGWQKVFTKEDGTEYWRRPGKDHSWSAVFHGATGRLKCFSSSCSIPTQGTQSKFACYSFLNHGGNFTEAARALRKLGYGSAPRASGNNRAEPKSKPDAKISPADLGVREAHTIVPTSVTWEWKDRIAKGKFFLVMGDGADGKSQITIRIAAAYSTGGMLPGGTERAPCCDVLICQAEDGLEDTVVPRLIAAGANLKRIKSVKPTRRMLAEDGKTILIDPKSLQDLDYWEDLLTLYPDAGLLLLDPIPSYIGRGVNDHKNADLRQVLDPFFDFMESKGVTSLGITHIGKATDGRRAAHKALGSVAYTNRARGAFGTGPDDKDPTKERRLFCHVKPYNAKIQPTLVYKIVPFTIDHEGEQIETSRVEFLDETDERMADEIMNQKVERKTPGPAPEIASPLAEWLFNYLFEKPKTRREVFDEAGSQGLIGEFKLNKQGKWRWTRGTYLYRAKKLVPNLPGNPRRLVIVEQQEGDGTWYWGLFPETPG